MHRPVKRADEFFAVRYRLVYCVTYAPDGLRLAAGGDLGRVVVWDAE